MGLDDWRSIYLTLRTRFRTGDFATGLRLVNAIGEAAEAANHHPDVDLRYGHVDVTLTSHDVHAKTQRDVDLARRISGIAAGLGVAADPGVVQELELAIDTWDIAEIRPFWAAVLALADSPRLDDELVDPSGNLPTIWFQHTDRHEEPRQRFHLDIRVPPEVAGPRIAAALAAGGVLADESQAPAFTVLADSQGNKACVCTHLGRPD
ncbi:4a-hydroxytetrahydrobiopterin dehydratase [Nocardioides sp. AE5]|uniref:4a-hydroxytetrahydrobiopterin dehydratase n=1 Tax=Nocardioides sp. AE5 TaxID=2962573 RepID=UPI002881E977|nr:4a-hydroxytetrahydrobiopterin dehydratase [Nocardioides sp. AE5]MDT0203396.1 4a-hydroxytetrahydrobiopterin dehydratase [Nocardioides sp. AE5]